MDAFHVALAATLAVNAIGSLLTTILMLRLIDDVSSKLKRNSSLADLRQNEAEGSSASNCNDP